MSNLILQKRTQSERPGQLAWDDLRTVLAIARSGSLSGAARALDVEHSTVFRRLEEIERRLGTSLFERSRSGYLVNAHGEAVAEAARTMEEAALAAERRVLGADARLTGVVRIATSEMLGTYLLPRLLEDFLAAHPEMEVEVEISNRAVDLDRREADLALRATMTPPDHLIARKIGEIGSAIYATPALAQRVGADAPLHTLPWIGFEGGMANVLQAKWMREAIPDAAPRLRMDSFPAIIQAAALGVGVAALPVFAAAQEPRLVRISDVLPPRMNCWLLTHPDVRDNARVRALLLHIAERTPPLLEKLACEGRMCERMVCAHPATPLKRGRRGVKNTTSY
jgi:DNA-binding transcriptional LysR family regulator